MLTSQFAGGLAGCHNTYQYKCAMQDMIHCSAKSPDRLELNNWCPIKTSKADPAEFNLLLVMFIITVCTTWFIPSTTKPNILKQQLKPHLQTVTPTSRDWPCALVIMYYENGGLMIEHWSFITIF